MTAWLALALVALVVWSVQRAISKAALATLSTPQLYTLTAVISLPIYLPTLAFDPPPASAFPPALGLSAMMALTFGSPRRRSGAARLAGSRRSPACRPRSPPSSRRGSSTNR